MVRNPGLLEQEEEILGWPNAQPPTPSCISCGQLYVLTVAARDGRCVSCSSDISVIEAENTFTWEFNGTSSTITLTDGEVEAFEEHGSGVVTITYSIPEIEAAHFVADVDEPEAQPLKPLKLIINQYVSRREDPSLRIRDSPEGSRNGQSTPRARAPSALWWPGTKGHPTTRGRVPNWGRRFSASSSQSGSAQA